MPRTSKSWTAGDPGTAVEFNKIRDDFDDLYSKGSDRMKVYRIAADPALRVTIGAGNWRVGSAEGQYAGGLLTVAVSVTTYIMIDSAGTIQTSTVGWNGQYARLAVVVSGAAAITSITLWRNDAVGGELGAAGFGNITSTTYTKGLLTAFTADGVNFTITYKYNRIYTISNGTNTWTATYSKGYLISTSKT